MSQQEIGDPGTGVKDVIDVLTKTPPKRLSSLTNQLGSSTEEDIVHALCLFLLQREVQALDKLQAHADNILAKQLSEKWQQSASQFEVFKSHCSRFQEPQSLTTLARMFKVLTQHGLCDRTDLIRAYVRALPSESSDSNVLQYNLLMEEAKDVCGPQFAELLCSFTKLKLVSGFDNESNMGKSTALHHASSNGPSSLHTSYPSYPSYPSELEISQPPTCAAQPNTRAGSLNESTALSSGLRIPMQPEPSQSFNSVDQKLQFKIPQSPIRKSFPGSFPQPPPPAAAAAAPPPPAATAAPPPPPPAAAAAAAAPPPAAAEQDTELEEEETRFYSFVILHAQDDADMAEDLKYRLESIIGSDGASFSEDFAVAGKAEFICVEDAINNSAFTLLLLTTNFNKFLEMKTNSALINSIENPPKYNTVIPLLPQSKAMPREDTPMVIKTLVPLVENKNFERKIKQAMSGVKIKRQKTEWLKEKNIKSLKKKQEKLKISNQQQLKENQELRNIHGLEQEQRMLLNQKLHFVSDQRMEPDGRRGWQQHSNINIENAQYIIIGDHSQMAVDLSKESRDKDGK